MNASAKLRYPLNEFLAAVGLSRSKAYERIKRGELRVVRDGSTLYVHASEAERYAKTNLPSPYVDGKAVGKKN